MDFDPRLNELQLFGRKTAIQHAAILNGQRSLAVLVSDVDVRQVVSPVITEKHQNQNAVEHADGRHLGSPIGFGSGTIEE